MTAPQLDVSFRRHPVRGTYLERRLFRWPYALSRGFRLDAAPADMLTLIVQTVSGAINGDDRLCQRVVVEAGAAAHVTTQGAASVNRAAAELAARDDIALYVAEGGTLEYLPDPRILFPDSRLSQRIALSVAETATAIVSDGFVLHDPAQGNRGFRHYSAELDLRRPDGTLLACDRVELDAPPRAKGVRARFVAHGTLIVATVQTEDWLAGLCAAIESALPEPEFVYAAASTLPNGAGVSLRVAATNGRHLRRALHAGWTQARIALFGQPRR